MNRANTLRQKGHWVRIALGSIAVVAAVVAALGIIAFIKYRQIQTAMAVPPPPEAPVAVTLAQAEPITFRQTSVAVGTVLAPQSIRLRTELTGVVTDVPMVPGKEVKKGELLVQFDVRTEQLQLKAAEAALKLATSAHRRAEQLAKANANSIQELEVAAAELTRAQSEVERLQVLIKKKSLLAPFDAKVGLFDLHIGQYLDSGSEIATLEGIAEYVHVDFAMPAHIADSVKEGDEVRLRTTAAQTSLPASIIAIDSQADPISRSVTARARLNQPPATLQPNDSVRVVIEYGDSIAAQSVPATAIRRGPSGTFVFVAAADREGKLRAQSKPILLAGGGDGSKFHVVHGIASGESVVADGSFKVTDNAMLFDTAGTKTSNIGESSLTGSQEKSEAAKDLGEPTVSTGEVSATETSR
jgi:membrane fusion protein, multidrug efflux system